MDQNIVVPINRDILSKAIEQDLSEKMDGLAHLLTKEQQAAFKDFLLQQNELRRKYNDLEKELDGTQTNIRDRVQKLEGIADQKLKWSILPVAVLMTIAGAAIIWSTLNGTAFQLEKRSKDLMVQVDEKQAEVTKLAGQIETLQKLLPDIQSKAGSAADLKNRFDLINGNIKQLNDRVKGLDDSQSALRTRVAQAEQSQHAATTASAGK